MSSSLVADLLDGFDKLAGGTHPGFRPVHAKGLMYGGTFTPSPEAAKLTRAPHANADNRSSTGSKQLHWICSRKRTQSRSAWMRLLAGRRYPR